VPVGERKPETLPGSSATDSPAVAPPRNRIATEIPPSNGKPSTLFFVEGSLCPHCMSQLSTMAELLGERNVQVSVVSASTAADLRNFPAVPFTLVADPEYKLFREYKAFDGKPKHATIVRDRAGKELFAQGGQ